MTGLVKLIKSTVCSWLVVAVVEFLLDGTGGGANITAFLDWLVLQKPGLGLLLHWNLSFFLL